jgi:hypothetical protein
MKLNYCVCFMLSFLFVKNSNVKHRETSNVVMKKHRLRDIRNYLRFHILDKRVSLTLLFTFHVPVEIFAFPTLLGCDVHENFCVAISFLNKRVTVKLLSVVATLF